MTPIFPSTRDCLGFVMEALPALVAVAAWLFYRYVLSVMTQNRLMIARHLADTAIDYVQDLDHRGDLTMPERMEKGTYKRELAAAWPKSELENDGIKMGDEQARRGITSEFHKGMGGVQYEDRLRDVNAHSTPAR